MSTSSGYPYPSDNWIPKDQRTTMQNPPEGLIVERAELPEHLSSEPDLSHQRVTSTQSHWKGLVMVSDGNVRNLQTVLFNVEADKQMRCNALRQLQSNVTQRDCEDSCAVLAQWQECGLTLD